MKKLLLPIFYMMSAGLFAQDAFKPGNIVVARVGVPDIELPASTAPVFLEEFSPGGRHIQTIALPNVGDGKITLGGRSVTEGNLRRSVDGKYLTIGGYNLVTGTSSPTSSSTGAERTIARIDADGQVDVTTRLPVDSLYPNAAFRAVVTDNGNRYWTAGGTQGLRYVQHGSKQSILISGTVTNMRGVDIQAGNLYLSHGSGSVNTRVMQVGEGLTDTAGVTATPLPGIPTSGASVCDIFFADLNPEIAGPDVLYLADDLTGLRKYSLVEGTWVLNGIAGTSGDAFRDLTGISLPGGVILYTTLRAGNQATGGGQMARLTDLSGYNQPFNSTIEVLAVAAPNTGFRGIALSPVKSMAPVKDYIFNGNGNWSLAGNWKDGLIPPAELPSGHQVIVNPAPGGLCILDVLQTAQQGGILVIAQASQFIVNGNLEMQ